MQGVDSLSKADEDILMELGIEATVVIFFLCLLFSALYLSPTRVECANYWTHLF